MVEEYGTMQQEAKGRAKFASPRGGTLRWTRRCVELGVLDVQAWAGCPSSKPMGDAAEAGRKSSIKTGQGQLLAAELELIRRSAESRGWRHVQSFFASWIV
jgi:hypothetical protein